MPKVRVVITHDQAKYLAFGPSADGVLSDQGTLVVAGYDEAGWLMVKSLATEEDDGAGVWVDPYGVEHYGGGQPPSVESPIIEYTMSTHGVISLRLKP